MVLIRGTPARSEEGRPMIVPQDLWEQFLAKVKPGSVERVDLDRLCDYLVARYLSPTAVPDGEAHRTGLHEAGFLSDEANLIVDFIDVAPALLAAYDRARLPGR
jgi:hypothetical protein